MPMFCDPNQVVLGAMALTEAEAARTCRRCAPCAKRVEGGYLLNGSKRFITNGGIADVHVIFATTDPTAGWAGIQAFVVDKGDPGLNDGYEGAQDGRARLAHRRGHPGGLLRARRGAARR